MNVPLLEATARKYYDPQRSWALQPGGRSNRNNWYDTGASLLEDIINTSRSYRPDYPNLDTYYTHYFGGSWRGNDIERQAEWLQKNEAYLGASG